MYVQYVGLLLDDRPPRLRLVSASALILVLLGYWDYHEPSLGAAGSCVATRPPPACPACPSARIVGVRVSLNLNLRASSRVLIRVLAWGAVLLGPSFNLELVRAWVALARRGPCRRTTHVPFSFPWLLRDRIECWLST